MLKSQRDFSQACARFMPDRQPEREFSKYDQDELRLAMQKSATKHMAPTSAAKVKNLMSDGRWRMASEIAKAVGVNDPEVRKILSVMEARGEITSMTYDGTKCWSAEQGSDQ